MKNSMLGENKEVVSFIKTIPHASGVLYYSERIKAAGTVEEIRIRIYQGVRKDLRIRPYILHTGDRAENLIKLPSGTDQYISGEDDYFVFPVVVPVDVDDQFVVAVENVSAVDDFTLSVHGVIDYYGGKKRVIGGVIGG